MDDPQEKGKASALIVCLCDNGVVDMFAELEGAIVPHLADL